MCEGSGWVGIIRSKSDALAAVGLEKSFQEAEDRWE
jgi:hypothetical protein